MIYTSKYHSPLGEILLAEDEDGLIGCWFDGQKYYASKINDVSKQKETETLRYAKKWLDVYFKEEKVLPFPKLHLIGTEFQQEVWKHLLNIPYGQTTTYGDLSKKICSQKKISAMSAQAIGSAVGKNPISIIIPCHRVIGANGNLTGYAGGLERKQALLDLERLHKYK